MSFLKKFFRKKSHEASKGEKESSERKEILATARRKELGVEKSNVIPGIILRPHITEKTASVSKEHKYVFIVASGTVKSEVSKAVARKYGVHVREVKIITVSGKERKRGQQIGWRPGYKKAIVTLEKGQSIEIQ